MRPPGPRRSASANVNAPSPAPMSAQTSSAEPGCTACPRRPTSSLWSSGSLLPIAVDRSLRELDRDAAAGDEQADRVGTHVEQDVAVEHPADLADKGPTLAELAGDHVDLDDARLVASSPRELERANGPVDKVSRLEHDRLLEDLVSLDGLHNVRERSTNHE